VGVFGFALLSLAACGRIGFDPTSNGDGGTGDALPPGRWKSVATNGEGTCAITLAGEAYCAGFSFYANMGHGVRVLQPLDLIDASTDWAAVETGSDATYLIKTDGSMWAVGFNLSGAIPGTSGYSLMPVRIGADTWTRIKAEGDHACAVRTDQTLACWGGGGTDTLGNGSNADQNAVTPVATAGVDRYVDVAIGRDLACGIQPDGSLWCWGDNVATPVGDGANMARLVPVQIGAGQTWVSVSAGWYHACAVEMGGQLWCWGSNSKGQLGDGTTKSTSTPKLASTIPPLASVAAGETHTCGLTTAGHAYCWGGGEHGELGSTVATSPGIDLGPATALSVQWEATCIVDDQAHLLCTGQNNYGQTGPTPSQANQPTRADQRTDWTAIGAQLQHTCGTVSSGEVYCWGTNNIGQLGDGTTLNRKSPVGPGPAVTELAVGGFGAVGIQADGSVTRTGHLLDNTNTSTWTQTLGAGSALHVAEGGGQGCRIVPGGTTLHCGGSNNAGQLGDTTTVDKVDVQVAGAWAAVFAGYDATCGITTGSQLQCWGTNTSGQLGIGSMANVSAPTTVTIAGATGSASKITIGNYFACALMTSGELYCAGAGSDGQLGNGGNVDSNVYVRAGTASNWIDLAAGDRHVCAIAADHTLWCWGHSDQGQTGPSPHASSPQQVGTDTDWMAIACGQHFTCALKLDGTRWCMGVNGSGELGDGLGWNDQLTVIP
jgi:alpha-tubulin suppressor-like RCC1 family protein